ncbi:hypothetical protein [Nocardia sp. NPDC004711]
MKRESECATLHRDRTAGRELQEFLPPRLRITAEDDLPAEEFWEWKGNDIHLDQYLNPRAPAARGTRPHPDAGVHRRIRPRGHRHHPLNRESWVRAWRT